MSVVTINYEKLSTISKNAKSASSKMQDYIDDLTKKVTNKYSGITGGASTKTNNSEYYVNQKIKQLKKNKAYYSTFSTAVSTFSSNAQEIDSNVAKTIKASKDKFIDKHDYVDVNWWTELKEWFVDLKNSCPLFSVIGNLIDKALDGLSNMWAEFKHWYRCGGGKELIGIVLAVAGAVVAVVLAICACVPPICGIVAVCAAIAAVITAANAVYNVFSSMRAAEAKLNGDPAWAKIYSDQDTVQDGLRQTNFGDGTLNKLSYLGAGVIDLVKTVCDVVVIVNSIKNVCNTLKEIKAYANRSSTRNFGDVLKAYIKNDVRNKNAKVESTNIFGKTTTKPSKMRDYIQSRVDKKDHLKQCDKLIKQIKKGASTVKSIFDTGEKILDYTVGGEFSFKNLAKDVGEGVADKFNIGKTIDKIWKLGDNFKSTKSSFGGLRANYSRGYNY